MPKNRLLGLLVAALVIVPAAPALAGPTVSVRVEGQSATLLPATTVTLPDVKAAGNPCTDAGAARSVAAAIEEATGGNWDRQGFTQTILGETHAFAASDYWAEWVNDKFGGGICSDVVQTGDRILMLVDVSGPPPTYSSGRRDCGPRCSRWRNYHRADHQDRNQPVLRKNARGCPERS